ncbi:MAG: phosphatase PAP2 family protein [Acidobacteria bacterium]|nr:phosphatase PAP2 family protein [Acidobacteriota bacterium]
MTQGDTDAATQRHGDGETPSGRDTAIDNTQSDATRMVEANGAVFFDGVLNPADKAIIVYLAILIVLMLLAHERVEKWPLLVAVHTSAILFFVALAKWLAPPLGNFGRYLRGWNTMLVIPLTYKELEYLVPRLHPRDFDWQLAALDYRVFGVQPTVWLERFLWPPLTEIFQITYATYYFYPLILGIVLWRKGWFVKFHFWALMLMLGLLTSYLGYIAVPAIGPRFILAAQQTQPLTGVFLFQTIRATLDKAEGITRDCFPSGHTELTLLTLYYAWRFHKPTFKWFVVPCSMIILSTVYLRYHYVVDVVAGIAFAIVLVLLAKWLHRQLGGQDFLYDSETAYDRE